MDKNTKKLSIAGDLHSATLAFYVELRGMDRAMFDLLEFPELVHAVISPEHWRKYIFPHIKDVCSEIHRYGSGARIYCHICGNILPVAEDLVKTGLDCIGPLDPLGGFKPEDIRKRVGDDVSLLGGVDTLSFINKSPPEIIEDSGKCIEQAGTNGGYILSSGCVIPRSAPLENVRALREATEKYGLYRE